MNGNNIAMVRVPVLVVLIPDAKVAVDTGWKGTESVETNWCNEIDMYIDTPIDLDSAQRSVAIRVVH